jgi:hypothetical protein
MERHLLHGGSEEVTSDKQRWVASHEKRWVPVAAQAGWGKGARSRPACRRLGASNLTAGVSDTSKVALMSALAIYQHSAKVTCARTCHLRTCAGFDFYVRRR